MSDIFDEVSGDLRAERTRRILRRYGWLMALAAVALMAGIGLYQWRHQQSRERADTLGSAFMDALAPANAIKPTDPGAEARRTAAAGFARVASEAADHPGYRALAKLWQAGLLAEAGDAAAATAIWDTVAGDSAAEPLLRQLAAYQAAAHLADTGAPDAASRLDAIAQSSSAYHPLAAEARAALAIKAGDLAAARETLKHLADDPQATPALANRARGLLEQLGSGQ